MQRSTSNILKQEIDPAFALRAEYILSAIEKNKPQRILDAGCGRGFYTRMVSRYTFPKEIQGVDMSDYYLSRARKALGKDSRVSFTKGSIYKLPLPDNHFDCVVCSEVLEHLDDVPGALKELNRVLKPQGRLLISVPHERFPFLWDPLNWALMKVFNTHVHKDIWWLAGIWADHERLYSQALLRKHLEDGGFSVHNEKGLLHWCWPFSHFALYAIGKNIVERLGAREFDRFNFESDKPLSRKIAWFMRIPSQLLDSRFPRTTSMNIVAEGRKK